MSFGNLTKIIGSAKVNFRINLCFVEGSKKVRHWRNWIGIFFNLFESTIVDTKKKGFIGFWYEKNRKAHSGSARANESPYYIPCNVFLKNFVFWFRKAVDRTFLRNWADKVNTVVTTPTRRNFFCQNLVKNGGKYVVSFQNCR